MPGCAPDEQDQPGFCHHAVCRRQTAKAEVTQIVRGAIRQKRRCRNRGHDGAVPPVQEAQKPRLFTQQGSAGSKRQDRHLGLGVKGRDPVKVSIHILIKAEAEVATGQVREAPGLQVSGHHQMGRKAASQTITGCPPARAIGIILQDPAVAAGKGHHRAIARPLGASVLKLGKGRGHGRWRAGQVEDRGPLQPGIDRRRQGLGHPRPTACQEDGRATRHTRCSFRHEPGANLGDRDDRAGHLACRQGAAQSFDLARRHRKDMPHAQILQPVP